MLSLNCYAVDYFFNRRKYTKPRVGSEPKAHPKVKNAEMLVSTTKNEQSAKVDKGGYNKPLLLCLLRC